MNTVKVIFNNGDYLITNINGTKKEVKDYYLNRTFNIGTVEDKMVECVKLEFIK